MKNPGPVVHGSVIHRAMLAYVEVLAQNLEASNGPIFGQLLKMYECMGKAAESPFGMSALVIEFREPDDNG